MPAPAVVKPWYRSETIQGAAWIFASAVLGALLPMISARQFDGWQLAFVAVSSLVVALKRCYDPDIVGPLPSMNVNNKVGTPG